MSINGFPYTVLTHITAFGGSICSREFCVLFYFSEILYSSPLKTVPLAIAWNRTKQFEVMSF